MTKNDRIIHHVTTKLAGGLVSQRDFVIVATFEKHPKVIWNAMATIETPLVPVGYKGYVR